jgi:hypothetical protein
LGRETRARARGGEEGRLARTSSGTWVALRVAMVGMYAPRQHSKTQSARKTAKATAGGLSSPAGAAASRTKQAKRARRLDAARATRMAAGAIPRCGSRARMETQVEPPM